MSLVLFTCFFVLRPPRPAPGQATPKKEAKAKKPTSNKHSGEKQGKRRWKAPKRAPSVASFIPRGSSEPCPLHLFFLRPPRPAPGQATTKKKPKQMCPLYLGVPLEPGMKKMQSTILMHSLIRCHPLLGCPSVVHRRGGILAEGCPRTTDMVLGLGQRGTTEQKVANEQWTGASPSDRVPPSTSGCPPLLGCPP